MVRWLEPQEKTEPSNLPTPSYLNGSVKVEIGRGEITDDPLAIISRKTKRNQIYSVTRSVMLPRISINKDGLLNLPNNSGGGVNPLFNEHTTSYAEPPKIPNNIWKNNGQSSSGYSSSCTDNIFVVGQNPHNFKTSKIVRSKKRNVPSSSGTSGSSSSTLNAIPEGKIAWDKENYDSIVDDALLLYTSLNYSPEKEILDSSLVQMSVTELLVDILKNVNSAIEENHDENHAEEVLKQVTNKINLGLEVLKNSTEEDMKKLCINLRNCKRVNSVLRAFGNSGNTSSASNSNPRSSSSETDDFYHLSSPSSSVGSSDNDNSNEKTGSLLRSVNANEKPSVWEQYYGVQATRIIDLESDNPKSKSSVVIVPKPTDVPIFPNGRPEADFTLDVPRLEHLNKKMKQDKKWRFRCRLLTSFLGLVFFFLSVMAVSLMLTRGKRMFGSMM